MEAIKRPVFGTDSNYSAKEKSRFQMDKSRTIRYFSAWLTTS